MLPQDGLGGSFFSFFSSGGPGSSKTILFACVAVLGLAFGGLTYWYVLRKHAVNSAPNNATVSQPATPAVDKPSPAQSTAPAADTAAPAQPATGEQSTAPPAAAADTTKAASGDSGAASTAAAPAKSADAEANAPPADLSGFWEGEYTNTNQVTKVTLQIAKNSADLFTGTMVFDSGGTNSSRCTVGGVYNPQSKFLVVKVADCQGQPPAYLQGKIGFSSVELSAKQMFGVDSAHNSFLNITRQ